MREIYYLIAGIAYTLFIVQFILSWIGADIDFDSDVSVGDIVSFKGLLHFVLGFISYLCLASTYTWKTYLVAVIIGIIFMVIIYYCYKLCMNLKNESMPFEGKDLVGKTAKITLPTENGYYVMVGLATFKVNSSDPYKIGDEVIIKNYKNGVYYI